MSRCQDDVIPKLVSEHLLHQADHASKRVGHSVVLLLEGDDECVNKLDFVSQDVDQALDRSFLLDQVVAEPGSVDDGEVREDRVAEKVTLILTSETKK